MKNTIRLSILAITSAWSLNGIGATSGSDKNSGGIGVEAHYHPRAQVWVQGKKDAATYAFSGYSWLAYVTQHGVVRSQEGYAFSPPTLALWGDVLTNTYTQQDTSGATARENLKTQGIGVGFIGRDSQTGIAGSLLVGAERAYLDQSGDTPRSQRYPYGASARGGLGWSPSRNAVGLDIRCDYVFKHFPSATWNDESLKTMQIQSLSPVLGISFNY